MAPARPVRRPHGAAHVPLAEFDAGEDEDRAERLPGPDFGEARGVGLVLLLGVGRDRHRTMPPAAAPIRPRIRPPGE